MNSIRCGPTTGLRPIARCITVPQVTTKRYTEDGKEAA